MKNIFAKAAAILFVALIPSLLAAAVEQDFDKQKLKVPARRSYSRKADDVKLNCDKKTLGEVLAKLNPDKAHTIRVSGACNENVDIVGFQHLILIAEDGASITDASGGEFPVLYVAYTTLFEMVGFTIDGGTVVCASGSNCFFADDTFQYSPGVGVFVDQSKADIIGAVIQNNGQQGLLVQNGSAVTILEVSLLNNVTGGNVGHESTLYAINSTIQGNTNHGLRAIDNSVLRLEGNTITGSGGDGILARFSSVAFLQFGNIVTNNGGAGVRINDLSMGLFSGEDVTGNLGGTDVLCEPQFPATRGALTSINGGTTNCVEP